MVPTALFKMKQVIYIELTPEDLHNVIMQALSDHEAAKVGQPDPHRTFTINQARKLLKRSHASVKKLVQDNTLKTTADGRVTEISIHEYLNSHNNNLNT